MENAIKYAERTLNPPVGIRLQGTEQRALRKRKLGEIYRTNEQQDNKGNRKRFTYNNSRGQRYYNRFRYHGRTRGYRNMGFRGRAGYQRGYNRGYNRGVVRGRSRGRPRGRSRGDIRGYNNKRYQQSCLLYTSPSPRDS